MPPWISTSLNAGYFKVEDLPGKIFEAKALVDQERQGYFLGVIQSAVKKDKEIELEVFVCGASDRAFLSTVLKQWKIHASFTYPER